MNIWKQQIIKLSIDFLKAILHIILFVLFSVCIYGNTLYNKIIKKLWEQ